MENRYTALRVIAIIVKIMAWIALIVGLLGAIGALFAGFTLSNQGPLGLNIQGPLAGIAAFVVTLVFAVINFLFLYAVGESIYLFLAIEENTRRTAFLLQQQYTPRQPAYHAPPSPQDYEG
jgi:nicotinamide riboside transporter PnuC